MILLIAVPKDSSSPCPPIVIAENLSSGETKAITPRELSEFEKELCRLGKCRIMDMKKENPEFTFLLLPTGTSLPLHVRDQARLAVGLYIPKSNRLRKAEKKETETQKSI